MSIVGPWSCSDHWPSDLDQGVAQQFPLSRPNKQIRGFQRIEKNPFADFSVKSGMPRPFSPSRMINHAQDPVSQEPQRARPPSHGTRDGSDRIEDPVASRGPGLTDCLIYQLITLNPAIFPSGFSSSIPSFRQWVACAWVPNSSPITYPFSRCRPGQSVCVPGIG